jgi:hypothetical protein
VILKKRGPGATLAVALVSTYLLLVGAWLLLTRQIPNPGFGRILRALIRRPYEGPITDVRSEQGLCFLAGVPENLLSDKDSASSLVLLEDGRPIGTAHAAHDEIRRAGAGRYSHWGAEFYFSTPDGSDPRSNGRRYSVREVRSWE